MIVPNLQGGVDMAIFNFMLGVDGVVVISSMYYLTYLLNEG